MNFIRIHKLLILLFFVLSALACTSQYRIPLIEEIKYPVYPSLLDEAPKLPSPCQLANGKEYIVAHTNSGHYAIIEVSMTNTRDICLQLITDTFDFPHLAITGIHDQERLDHIEHITGRHVDQITDLGLPGGLSQAGFMAKDEDIISVLKGDNQIVMKMGLTHPALAKPLFHVLNMMDTDLALDRWNMSIHEWGNIRWFYYNNQMVKVIAHDTKGGQKSIFNDQLEGAFHIQLWRELSQNEKTFLKEKYAHLPSEKMDELVQSLSFFNTGEIEPQYIMRYGFYEGHTFWRADPISISFIFGLKKLEELDLIFESKLDQALAKHFTVEDEN